jgi:hypothetical protein
MNQIIIIACILLSGCTTYLPVHRNFPVLPTELSEQCSELTMLQPESKLSDVKKTVAENYSLYHQCKNKHTNIVEWYDKQKQIFENIK